MSILDNIVAAIRVLAGDVSREDMEARLDQAASTSPERLDWRNSIVDLMKLVNMDSSLQNRERLAAELGYEGHFNGDPAMNEWLHQKVMERLR